MNSALQLPPAERLDSGASVAGRSTASASQTGPSFADLLQRGQAAHSAPARAADPPPSQGDSPPREEAECERSDAAPVEPPPETPGTVAKGPAKPALRAREKAPASTPAARASSPPASAAANASEALTERQAADDSGGGWPPGTVPIVDLHEWMASLTPPEHLPAQPGRAAAQDPAAAVGGAAAPRPASAANGPGLAATASTLVSASGAAVPMAADDAALLRPAEGAAVPEPADGSTTLRPTDGAALPRSADRAVALRPTDFPGTPVPAGGAAVLPPTDRDTLFGPARPAPGAMNGLRAQHGAAERDDPRRSDVFAAMQGARPAAPTPDPATLASGERRQAAPDLPAMRDFVQGMLGGAAGAVPRGFDAGTLAPIALPTPLHSPEFAQLLGAQVSVLRARRRATGRVAAEPGRDGADQRAASGSTTRTHASTSMPAQPRLAR